MCTMNSYAEDGLCNDRAMAILTETHYTFRSAWSRGRSRTGLGQRSRAHPVFAPDPVAQLAVEVDDARPVNVAVADAAVPQHLRADCHHADADAAPPLARRHTHGADATE